MPQIASAFGITEDELLNISDYYFYLPPGSGKAIKKIHELLNKEPIFEEDRLRSENNELFDRLSKEKQQQAVDYLRFLVDHQDKE